MVSYTYLEGNRKGPGFVGSQAVLARPSGKNGLERK
jgi:hypothetical protein